MSLDAVDSVLRKAIGHLVLRASVLDHRVCDSRMVLVEHTDRLHDDCIVALDGRRRGHTLMHQCLCVSVENRQRGW